MKILIVEDDLNIRKGIKDFLEDENYEIIEAIDGLDAIQQYQDHIPDFILLDIMMPKKNGYDVCKEIRKMDTKIPILFLSAKSEEIDRGADDYLMKPFGLQELLARIRAIYRRTMPHEINSNNDDEVFRMNHLIVKPKELRVDNQGQVSEISKRELSILQALFLAPSKAFDRNDLMNIGWGLNHFPNSRTLDQLISQLRKKVEKNTKEPTIIQTIHGTGYRFEKV
jgi:DNA-binding response OmpR family regulator